MEVDACMEPIGQKCMRSPVEYYSLEKHKLLFNRNFELYHSLFQFLQRQGLLLWGSFQTVWAI